MRYRKKGQKGFTLIEIMIAVSIVGVLFAVMLARSEFSVTKANAIQVRQDMNAYRTVIETVGAKMGSFSGITDTAKFKAAFNPYLDDDMQFKISDSTTLSPNTNLNNSYKDPWGNLYIVRYDKAKQIIMIASKGPDGKVCSTGSDTSAIKYFVNDSDSNAKDNYVMGIYFSGDNLKVETSGFDPDIGKLTSTTLDGGAYVTPKPGLTSSFTPVPVPTPMTTISTPIPISTPVPGPTVPGVTTEPSEPGAKADIDIRNKGNFALTINDIDETDDWYVWSDTPSADMKANLEKYDPELIANYTDENGELHIGQYVPYIENEERRDFYGGRIITGLTSTGIYAMAHSGVIVIPPRALAIEAGALNVYKSQETSEIKIPSDGVNLTRIEFVAGPSAITSRVYRNCIS